MEDIHACSRSLIRQSRNAANAQQQASQQQPLLLTTFFFSSTISLPGCPGGTSGEENTGGSKWFAAAGAWTGGTNPGVSGVRGRMETTLASDRYSYTALRGGAGTAVLDALPPCSHPRALVSRKLGSRSKTRGPAPDLAGKPNGGESCPPDLPPRSSPRRVVSRSSKDLEACRPREVTHGTLARAAAINAPMERRIQERPARRCVPMAGSFLPLTIASADRRGPLAPPGVESATMIGTPAGAKKEVDAEGASVAVTACLTA